MKSKNLVRKIAPAGVGLVLSFASGCMQIPQAGDFPNERISVAFLHHPVVTLLNGGEYHCDKIIESELRGIEIEKHHFLAGKTGEQRLYAPDKARDVGIRDSPEFLFEHNFWIGYSKDIDRDGKEDKIVDRYKVSWDGKKAKLAERYIYDFIREKWSKLEK